MCDTFGGQGCGFNEVGEALWSEGGGWDIAPSDCSHMVELESSVCVYLYRLEWLEGLFY